MMSPSLRLDVEAWTQKLRSVWKPVQIFEVRNRGTLGLLFIVQVVPSLTLHLNVQWTGVDTCSLWQGKHYVLWDSVAGFLEPIRTSEVSKEQQDFETEMRALIRRNCFLMGAEIQATDEEKRQWLAEYEGTQGQATAELAKEAE